MTTELVSHAVEAVLSGKTSYCKFLSANDSGETGGHQSGILISKTARNMLYTEQELKENHILKKTGTIKWQDDFSTSCTFTWYESKNELRITGFGRGFSLSVRRSISRYVICHRQTMHACGQNNLQGQVASDTL